MWRLEPSLDPRYLEYVRECLEVGEITEAVRGFAGAIYDVGWSDEEIDRYAGELETICKQLQTVAPFVYYGEAVRIFRKNARRV
jgi:hypothetical protein